jgi:hypothetical protein
MRVTPLLDFPDEPHHKEPPNVYMADGPRATHSSESITSSVTTLKDDSRPNSPEPPSPSYEGLESIL